MENLEKTKEQTHEENALFSLAVDIAMQVVVLDNGTIFIVNEKKSKIVH